MKADSNNAMMPTLSLYDKRILENYQLTAQLIAISTGGLLKVHLH